MARGCTIGREQAGKGSVILCVRLRNLGYYHSCRRCFNQSNVPPNVPNNVGDQMAFPNGSGLFQKDNAFYHTSYIVHEWLEGHNELEVLM